MHIHLYNFANKINNPLPQRALITATAMPLAFILGDGTHALSEPLAGGGSGG